MTATLSFSVLLADDLLGQITLGAQIDRLNRVDVEAGCLSAVRSSTWSHPVKATSVRPFCPGCSRIRRAAS